jgi:DNA repair exonuclease SbcCD nuclease subunit
VRLAHIADPHLGIRQYHRQTPTGINQREADVANAFRAAIDDVIACRPDAVLIAGDLFHAVRPSNAAIVFAFRQFQRLREGLAGVPVVLIAGNHDTPRSAETGTILRLFEDIGVLVASEEAKRFSFPALDLSVLAVPHQALAAAERPAMRPEGPERHQVLVIHGEAEGILAHERDVVEYGGAHVSAEEIGAEAWSYVAWGHYHVRHQVAPRAWYAGSLDYVSSNIWGELDEERRKGIDGKGWLLVDLDTGTVEPRAVSGARRVLDLPSLDADGFDAKGIDAWIAERIAEVDGGIGGHVVRLVVRNCPRHVGRELDHAAIRAWKNEALHFQLDVRRPTADRVTGIGAPGRRQTLGETLRDFLARRPLPSELDREAFVQAGAELLARIDAEAEG